jgi:molybdopterin-synthase adenylyltransferase
MSNVQLRLTTCAAKRVLEHLKQRRSPEPVAFALARHARTLRGDLVLVDQIVIPPASAFLPSGEHGARWKGSYMIELLNDAAAKGRGLFIFHFHSGSPVQMSRDDLASGSELLPKFQLVVPTRPHGSIVVGEDSVAGLILMPGREAPSERFTLRFFERRMVTYPLPEDPPPDRLRFERQPLVRGSRVSKILAQTKIAVVGQSGGGTHVAQQLAQLGVGEIYGIDDDHVEEGNRYAAVLIGEEDVKRKGPKVEAVRKHVVRTVPSVKYTPVAARVPETEALEVLKQADIIVGCVNNLHARADLQEVAHRYLIPYVDIGLSIETERDSSEEFPRIQTVPGNVFTFAPGGPCLWCIDFLTEEKLQMETQSRGRPYLRTVDNPDALVVSFNGVLASQAVNEVLQLLTGFAPEEYQSLYKKYDGLAGVLSPVIVRRNQRCPKCASFLGAGDPVWRS